MSSHDTAGQLLDAAQDLIQQRGHNSFSYKDLADIVEIRTASIHYHFPSKADLGEALVLRYLSVLEQALTEIDIKGRSSKAKLKRFIQLYRETEDRGCICLCGSLASDLETLPERVKDAVARYLARSQAWVSDTIRAGINDDEFTILGKPGEAAAMLLASLQGSLILARAQGRASQGGASVVDQVQRTFLHSLQES